MFACSAGWWLASEPPPHAMMYADGQTLAWKLACNPRRMPAMLDRMNATDASGPASRSAVRLRSQRSPGSARSSMRLGSLVYEQMKERLLEGTYAAGERLSVEALRTEFEVSKQPVMDALRRLAGERLVEITPQVGIQVSTYSKQEVEDFFWLFAGVESAIAGVAAVRRSEEQLVELTRAETQIENLRTETDPSQRARQYRIANRQFHGVIHAMAGSEIMVDVAQRMWDMSDFLINTSGVPVPLSDSLDERHSDHKLILDALLKRDGAAARERMQAHILGTVIATVPAGHEDTPTRESNVPAS